MPDSNQTLEKKDNNNEAPKKRSFFGGSLENAKELLDFRYNTQEEIDKFNKEITMPEDLDEIINKTKNNNKFEERKNKDTESKEDLQGSKMETYNNQTNTEQSETSKDKINHEIGRKTEETKEKKEIISDTDESNYKDGSIEGETHNEQSSDNTKIFDPFELNFDNFDENENNDEDKKEDEKEIQSKQEEEKKDILEQTQQAQEEDDEIVSPFKDEEEQEEKKEDEKEIQSKKEEEKKDILEQTQQSQEENDEDDEIISPFKDEEEQEEKKEDEKEIQSKQEGNRQNKENKDKKEDEKNKDTKENEEEIIGATNNEQEKNTTKGKKIKYNEDETEQGDEEINTTEDDKEYTKEEIFEQEPEFFANDELSQQFLELVQNTRNILKLEQRNGNQDNYFKIIGGKTEDKILEYSFYLIEEPDEPLDLYIKKVETNKENEETEHLVQFSYNENKELNIFVDEVILYENVNKADPETTEYNDTKSILEKFIFLTENYYNEINAKLEEEQKEKQKKRQLQQIFKGF